MILKTNSIHPSKKKEHWVNGVEENIRYIFLRIGEKTINAV
jgi:hypothetical protein